MDVRWVHGRPGEPSIQVHRHDEGTLILRQSQTVNFEGPFIFLLVGTEQALLLDTGATADPARFPLRATVDSLLPDGFPLVVAHTHAHGDHIKGDGQFTDRPHTVVVGTGLDAVREFFGFTAWPAERVHFDLGNRALEITGIPGHHETSIAVYDPASRFLFTGDTVLPGRLYVRDFPAFLDSLTRLLDLAGSRPVRAVLGCHIEMTTRPGHDYPMGATYQPDEAPLEFTVDQLRAVHAAALASADRPGVHRHDDFIIFHGPCTRAILGHGARLLWSKLTHRPPRTGPSPV